MDKLQSIKDNINSQLDDVDDLDELGSTKVWLEGWVCGVTDPILHDSTFNELKDQAMDYLNAQCSLIEERIK